MVSNLVAVRFTEIPSLGTDAQGVRAFVSIVEDRQHDAILAELEARWCARLRSLYGSVDPTNDPIREAAKFDQLLRLGVVSEEEHEQTAEQLRSLAAGVAGPLPATRH